MNIHSPAEVIETMCLLTHDANDIKIDVEFETIVISALEPHNHNFRMSWSYPGYGNERVRQIAQDYYVTLAKVIKEENKPLEPLVGYPARGQEVEFTRMNGGAIETVKGHVIRVDQDGEIEVHAFSRDRDGKFKYLLGLNEIHKPY